MSRMRHALILALAASFAGCSNRLIDFTVISSKNVSLPARQQGSKTTGKHCVFVFIIPFGIPNMKEAVDRAIESAGKEYDALVDGVLWAKAGLFSSCYEVTGTPINTKSILMGDLDEKNLLRHSERATASAPAIAPAPQP